ncbi:hypothetical protein SAMN05421869_106125 [Nonomuraea jiangxiensis]|uniref:Uncharacterized protein n=1 Tax=Nonomuraea jiangxiensis TaxID=633440 RepID=A0A1G8LKU4_9ACTN|nr:hypothetical protein SAMN05421869_106125 [Nonomuraea jiangxiensis]
MLMRRLPVSDLGGPIVTEPSLSSVVVPTTRIVPASRSRFLRWSAASSPHRKLAKVASRTSMRNRGSMASVRAKTYFMVSTGRSGESSLPASLMVHGLALISPSSTAVLKMAFRSRYALAR